MAPENDDPASRGAYATSMQIGGRDVRVFFRLDACQQMWLEIVDRSSGWTTAYRIEVQEGVPVFAEMRVFASTPDGTPLGTPGCWVDAPAPRGGLTRRLLRDVPLGAHLRSVPKMASVVGHFPATTRLKTLVAQNRMTETHTLPQRGKPDRWYAELARDYCDLVDKNASRRPIAELADAYGYETPIMRDYIVRARSKKFLTRPPGRGRPGGQLTQRALDLLDSA